VIQKKKREQTGVLNPKFLPSYRIAAILLFLFAIQAFWHAIDKSATYDETGHLTVSYLLWKTDHRNYEIGHPPLIRYLLGMPLWLTRPPLPTQMARPVVPDSVPLIKRPGSDLYLYSTYFFYYNRVSAETLLFGSRTVSIILGCFLAFAIFSWSRKLYGPSAGIFSLGLLAFCPNLIAHSSLATTDIGGVTLAVLFLYTFALLMEKNSIGRILLAGVCLGLALLSKTTNIILVPLFLVNTIFLKGFYLKKDFQSNLDRFREICKTILMTLLVAWFVLCAGYGFENVLISHTLLESDWNDLGFGTTWQTIYRTLPLPDSFIKGICYNIVHDQRGHGAFLLGQYYSFGWWYYFPIAFLLKTPAVTLLLILTWIVLLLKNRIRFSPSEIICLSTIVLLVGTAMNSKITIGLRHILLCYPLLYLLLGRITNLISVTTVKTKVIAGMLFLLLTVEILSVAPHYLAFFNRVVGGPKKGIVYLSDSNIDWGQDLKNLAKFLKKQGSPEVVLAYFGTAVPEYYGITYQSLPTVWSFPKSGHINSVNPKKEYLAISATVLQGTYFSDHQLYSRWLKNKKPIRVIGYSIYVYDITNDLEVHKRLLEIYRMTGEMNKFLRQAGRIKRLETLSTS